MSDKDEVPQDAEELKAPPTPKASDGSEEAGSAEIDLSSLASEIESIKQEVSKIPDMVDARFKSTKDRSVAGLVNRVDEIVSWVEKAGGDAGKIAGDLRLSQLEQELAELRDGGTAAASPKAENLADVSEDVLTRYEIAFNDADYLQLVAQSPAQSPEGWRRILEPWARKKSSKSSKAAGVTAAAAAGESGQAASPEGEQEALTAELQSFYAGEHGSLTEPENRKRIKEISKKLNELSPPTSAG